MDDLDVYIINLAKDTERWKHICRRFGHWHPHRIEAVYSPRLEEVRSHLSWWAYAFAPYSAIGCFMSHRIALQTFIKHSPHEYALILEDDAMANLPIKDLERFLSVCRLRDGIYRLDVDRSTPLYLCGLGSTLATAYVVHKKAAQKILRQRLWIAIDVDWNFWDIPFRIPASPFFIQDTAAVSNTKQYEDMFPSFFPRWVRTKIFRIHAIELSTIDLMLLMVSILSMVVPINL